MILIRTECWKNFYSRRKDTLIFGKAAININGEVSPSFAFPVATDSFERSFPHLTFAALKKKENQRSQINHIGHWVLSTYLTNLTDMTSLTKS